MSDLVATYRPTTTIEFLNASQTAVASVTCALKQITNPSRVSFLQAQLGLEKTSLILEARLTSPKALPGAAKAGMRAQLTWAGRAGVARLEPYQYNVIAELRDTYGEKILLSWRTDEIP